MPIPSINTVKSSLLQVACLHWLSSACAPVFMQYTRSSFYSKKKLGNEAAQSDSEYTHLVRQWICMCFFMFSKILEQRVYSVTTIHCAPEKIHPPYIDTGYAWQGLYVSIIVLYLNFSFTLR